MSISHRFLPNLLTLSILSVFHTAHAATPVEVANELPVTVVTASRAPQAISAVPASISVINKQQIQQSAVDTLSSQLRLDPALNVVQAGYGQQTSIFTRGTNSNHTLLLLDGVRLNPSTTSIPSYQFIDTTDISQIEILKGPASVQYGSDAIGGVVQLLSAKPTKQKLFTTVEGGENGLYKAIVGADLVKDDMYLQLRGNRLETDGFRVATNATKDSGFDQKGYSAKAGIDNQQFALGVEVRQNNGTAEYLNVYAPKAQTKVQDFNNRLLSLTGRYSLDSNLDLNLRLSQFKDELDQLNNKDFAHSDHTELDANARLKMTDTQNVLLGLTTRKTDADFLSGTSFGSGSGYDRTLKTTGYYLQHQFKDQIFSTQAGVRVEDDQDFGTHTIGQISGRMQVLPATSIYANIGTAFHAPDANQRFGFGGNIDLKPEESTSYEIGINQQLLANLSANLSVYHTQIKNIIVTELVDPVNFNYLNTNIDQATLNGGEASLKWSLNNWFAGLNYAYVQPIADGSNGTPDSELLRRPRQTLTASTGWQNRNYGFSVELVAKSHAKDTSNLQTGGYATGNLHGYWQALPNVRLVANVENFTDRKYAISETDNGFGDSYLAARRQATLGVTVSY